jgi:two-component system response regulator
VPEHRPYLVLFVEDSPADREIIRRAFGAQGDICDLRTVHDGEAALDFLLNRSRTGEAGPHPDLILLDLNLPDLSGRELLQRIRAVPELRHIPIVVLTTSHALNDVVECYRLGANSYLTKPNRFDDMVRMVDQTCNYWFRTATLPPERVAP